MKKIGAILLCSLILSFSCKDLVTYAHFLINQESIISQFCINIDKPELKCDGKCHLKQQIESNQEQEKEAPNTIEEKPSNVVFVSNVKNILPSETISTRQLRMILSSTETYNFAFLKEVFHPPRIC